MKFSALLAALLLGAHVSVQAQDDKPLTSNAEKFSYGIGLQIGQQLKRQGLTGLDTEAIALAIEDVLQGNNLRVSMEDMQVAATAYQNERNAEKLAAIARLHAAGFQVHLPER